MNFFSLFANSARGLDSVVHNPNNELSQSRLTRDRSIPSVPVPVPEAETLRRRHSQQRETPSTSRAKVQGPCTLQAPTRPRTTKRDHSAQHTPPRLDRRRIDPKSDNPMHFFLNEEDAAVARQPRVAPHHLVPKKPKPERSTGAGPHKL